MFSKFTIQQEPLNKGFLAPPKVDVLEFPFSIDFSLIPTFTDLHHLSVTQAQLEKRSNHCAINLDHYDRIGHASYLIAHYSRRVVGGVRLIKTNAQVRIGNETVSYLLKDLHEKEARLQSEELCLKTPPQDPGIWELSSLALEQVETVSLKVLVRALRVFMASKNGHGCVMLATEEGYHALTQVGCRPVLMGTPVQDGNGGQFPLYWEFP